MICEAVRLFMLFYTDINSSYLVRNILQSWDHIFVPSSK